MLRIPTGKVYTKACHEELLLIASLRFRGVTSVPERGQWTAGVPRRATEMMNGVMENLGRTVLRWTTGMGRMLSPVGHRVALGFLSRHSVCVGYSVSIHFMG